MTLPLSLPLPPLFRRVKSFLIARSLFGNTAALQFGQRVTAPLVAMDQQSALAIGQ